MNDAYANGSMSDFTKRLMKARQKTKTGKKKPGNRLAKAITKTKAWKDRDHDYR